MQNQFQHFVPKFLLKNFSYNEKKTNVYKYENGKWNYVNINETAGDDMFYGLPNNMLEIIYSKIEDKTAKVLNYNKQLKNKWEAYIKFFIFFMSCRSPTKNEYMTQKYKMFSMALKQLRPEEEKRYINDSAKRQKTQLSCLVEDSEMRKISDELIMIYEETNRTHFFADITKEVLKNFPKFGNYFKVHIFESEYDLIIGETPTISVNLSKNEVKTNGEEAGLFDENIMYWIPLANNKVAFMYKYKNIVPIKDRKLCKQDANILNYYQSRKNPYFYSKSMNINIPELPKDFNWVKDFNYIFGYKTNII
jgi:hypothetical protein